MNARKRPSSEETTTAPVLAGGTLAGLANGTIPPAGVYVSSDHDYWFNGRGPVPSVTTILGIIDKPAVGVWRAKGSARALLDAWDYLPAEWSEDERVLWALAQIDAYRDDAAELGSSVHLLASLVGASQTGSNGFNVSDREKPYIDAFNAFLGRYSASEIVSSEHAVWSVNGYAGTYDLIQRIDGRLSLIDIKTSKGIYPEFGLQLAGYRWADGIILPNDPKLYPMPELDATFVLHLRPDLYTDTGWRLIEYPTTYRDDYMAFLATLELYRWKKAGRFTKSRLVSTTT